MFGLVWGPTLAAVSVILDNAAQDPGVARRALDCLLLAARLATYHGVEEVVDSTVALLAKHAAAALLPPGPKGGGVVALGESAKARAALEALFAIANRCGTAQSVLFGVYCITVGMRV